MKSDKPESFVLAVVNLGLFVKNVTSSFVKTQKPQTLHYRLKKKKINNVT